MTKEQEAKLREAWERHEDTMEKIRAINVKMKAEGKFPNTKTRWFRAGDEWKKAYTDVLRTMKGDVSWERGNCTIQGVTFKVRNPW